MKKQINKILFFLEQNSDILQILSFLVLFAVLWKICGCARIEPRYNEQGEVIGVESVGFLRNVSVEQRKSDGSYIKMETKSTTSETLGAVNEIIGTTTGTAKEVLP